MAYKEKSKMYENNNRYINNTFDRINLTVPKGRKEIIKRVAEQNGESVNGFINRLIELELQRLTGEGFSIFE